MKRIIWLFAALILAQPVLAQKFEKAVEGKNVRISIQLMRSDIEVIGHDKNTILIEALDYEAPPEKAQGLRPIGAGGIDNTQLGLNVDQNGNNVMIREVQNRSGEYKIYLPKNAKLNLTKGAWGGGELVVKGMQSEIELSSTNGDILLDQVVGPIIANSTSGDMTVRFAKAPASGPSMISMVSGDLEVMLPESSKLNLELTSVSGDIYTNLDINYPDQKEGDMERIYHGMRNIKATLNGGGPELSIRTVSGDMYLRKN